MKAYEHADYCRDCSTGLFHELNKEQHGNRIIPLFKSNAKYRDLPNGDKSDVMCYVHPDDKDTEYIEDFKYPHREL